MRWSLRNIDKIKKYFEPHGEEILNRLEQSLNEAFLRYKNIDACIDNVENEPYPVLFIDDAGHSFNMVSFYVVSKQYDVYNLAFKEFIG